MASSLLQIFEQFQKARTQFVQSVAEAATRPQNIDTMQQAGVLQLLRPLLLDNVPSIQQTAALALGRLANYSDDLAEAVVANEILPQLVYSLGEQNVRACVARVCLFPPPPFFFFFSFSFPPHRSFLCVRVLFVCVFVDARHAAILQKSSRVCVARRRETLPGAGASRGGFGRP